MAKGTLFHVTTDVTELNAYKEDTFYGRLEELHADYVQDMEEEASETALSWFRESLEKLAVIRDVSNILSSAFSFTTAEEPIFIEKKKAYFKMQYEEFQRLSKALTLGDFISDSDMLYQVKQILDHSAGDMVFFQNTDSPEPVISTVNQFVRTLKPNTRYYVSHNTIRIH